MGSTVCETCEHVFTSTEIQDGELFEILAMIEVICPDCGTHTRVSVKSANEAI